jgi:hypothetical protein
MQNIPNEDYSQKNQPMKLISVSTTSSSSSSTTTQEPLAFFCPGQKDDKLNPRKISAKLNFLPASTSFPRNEKRAQSSDGKEEEMFKQLVVLSVLSMVERSRQSGERKGQLCSFPTCLSMILDEYDYDLNNC